MVNYNVDAASSGFDQFKRRSTNREVDPVSRSRINKSPLDDKTSSGFGGMGPDPEVKAMGLGSPTNRANKRDDDDDKDVGGIGRLFAKFFGAAEENGLEFTTPDRKPKPSIYDTDSMKPIDFDAMNKRIDDAVNYDLAEPMRFNFDQDEQAKSTYDEVQPLEGVDEYKARKATADAINKAIKGILDSDKEAIKNTVAPQSKEYKIKEGDTLSQISRREGVSVDDLVKINGIKDKNMIYAGASLIIPKPQEVEQVKDYILRVSTRGDEDPQRKFNQSGVPLDQRVFEPELGEGMEGVVGYDDVPQMVTGLMSKTNIVNEDFDTSDVESSRVSYESVKKVQKRLNDLGYTTLMGDLEVDGQLGGGTARQLRKFQAEAGLPVTAASGQPVDEATLKALKDNRFNNKEGKDSKSTVTTLQDGMFNIVKPIIADIESGGEVALGRDPYLVAGGSGFDYDGKYQLGRDAKATIKNMRDEDDELIFTAAERAKLDHDNNRADFRADSTLQEKAFRQFTEFNNSELTKNSQKYRDMDEGNKLAVLGYAHNQGAEAALEWLSTQVVGTDAFGTRGDKYSKAITDEFMKDDNLG